jgi:membrane-associated phospholipid phosphatase
MRHPHLRFLVILFSFLTTLCAFSQDTAKSNSIAFDSLLNSNLKIETACLYNARQDPDNIDVKIFRSIYDHPSSFKTSLALHFDNANNHVVFFTPIVLFTYARAYKKTYDENSAFLLAISEASTLGLTAILKGEVRRPRPYASLVHVTQRDTQTSDPYSFPSGHASSSFAFATMFALRYHNYPQCYVPIFLWSLVVSWGRPYLGMHYPSDILTGAALGALTSIAVYSVRNGIFQFKDAVFKERTTDDGSINGGVVSFFAATFILSDLLNTYAFKNTKFDVNASGTSSGRTMINLRWNF